MPNPTITTEFANPDPSTVVGSLSELVTELNALVTSEIQGSYAPYVVGDSTPAADDQDKVWVRLDSANRPLGTFTYYNGAWRRQYSGLSHELRMFTGDPATFFDGTGLGLTNNEWDGWALANGQNGTTNLSNLFVVGGQMDNVGISGYSSGWQTNVTGEALKTGGAASYALINNNLPNMTVQLTGYVYDAGASHSDKKANVSGKYDASASNTITIGEFGASSTGTPAQMPVPTVPPFYAVAYCQFVGYA